MPPRGFTNPPPKTESAREARKAFYCDLCSKGYSRQNELDAHESSYDHQHKKRLQELKAMNKTMDSSVSKARKAEEKSTGLIKIEAFGGASKKDGSGGGGFKKGGFKKAFGGLDDDNPDDGTTAEAITTGASAGTAAQVKKASGVEVIDAESDTDDEGYEHYDPRRPTGCADDCKGLA